MNGGGGDDPPSPQYPPVNGGELLLQLLRRPPHQPPTRPNQQPLSAATRGSPVTPPPAQNLSHDPAVAAVGPSLPFPMFPPNGHDLPYHRPPWPHSPPFAPHNFFLQGFPQNSTPNPKHGWLPSPSPPSDFNRNPQFNRQGLADDIQKVGLFGSNPRPDIARQNEVSLMFGSLPCEIRNNDHVPDGNTRITLAAATKTDDLSSTEREIGEGNRRSTGLDANFQNSPNFNQNPGPKPHAFQNQEQERRGTGGRGRGRQKHSGNFRAGVVSQEVRQPPPGFPNKRGNSGNGRFEHNVDEENSTSGELSHRGFTSNSEDKREKRWLPGHRIIGGDMTAQRRLSSQLNRPGPPAGSSLHSVSASDIEASLLALHLEVSENVEKPRKRIQDNTRDGPVRSELDDLDEQPTGPLVLEDGSDDKGERKPSQSSRDKDYRSDTRGQRILGQRMRNFKRQIECRNDIDRLNAPFLAIYESLIPPEEVKAKQKQLLALLEKLVSKEWPEARLYLYGSCANSFGVSKSDIDVCLAIDEPDVNKSEVLLKLADILQSDNLQNVQALTRARVPIVKLMDPVTGISCDICINNVLAVVNTKLLRDYAQIDVRLRQLAFIVKHWAKSRGVNETYHGTLSSYAYVIMCIHFLQQRKPAILPCLQEMERTYAVNVDNIDCAYFDQVDRLSGFGSCNRETIAQLVWAFFNYWAYCHDYANDVISIRTGSMLSKQAKDWTRRIGNDRHLICIEDPFEISHDLGRVVDKFSIRVLREEFERAAEIMQCDPNPCVRLFEPYIPN